MTKDRILTITGLHTNEGEENEPIEIVTPAGYFLKNGKHYVVYDEVMEGIAGTVQSTLKITEDKVELIRNGAASARMIFEESKEHQMIYQTPMGALSISLYTDQIDSRISEEEIELEIRYSLKTEGTVVSESILKLNVCPKELKRF